MPVLPKVVDMFGDTDNPGEIATRFEAYKAALSETNLNPTPAPIGPQAQSSGSDVAVLSKALRSGGVLNKAISPELLDSVREAIAQSDLGKEWQLGTGSNGVPVPGGLVAYDLEAPAKLLFPRPTPLRNKIARGQGVGQSHKFKRITGITGSGTGGQGIFRPGITENQLVQQPQGGNSPFYVRGAQISYGGDDQTVAYKQFGVSDQVSWAAQYAGQGYQDVRQMSQSAVLWSSMLLEERMLLASRGSDSGFSGAVGAPTGNPTPTSGTPGAGQVGLSGVTTNVYVQITSEGVWGESPVSGTAQSIATSNGNVVTVSLTGVSVPKGATGIRIYAGTGASAPASTGMFYVGRVPNVASTFVIQGALPTSGANPPAADTSAASTDYDGILTVCTGPNSGYVNQLNGVLSTGNPGNEFNVAFASLYDSVKADPEEILANGADRKQLSDALKSASSSNYRINLMNSGDAHNAQIGAMVTGVQNEITGTMVDVTVHPWLPQGNMPIISWTLPLPDSQVSDVFKVWNVQDYTAIEWPVIQYTYDISSYWFGTFVSYAPAWCAAVVGISKV